MWRNTASAKKGAQLPSTRCSNLIFQPLSGSSITQLVGMQMSKRGDHGLARQSWKTGRDADSVKQKPNLLASRFPNGGAARSPNWGNFGPSFSVTAGSIGANKHGPCMQDCGSVGGRTQHHGEDRSNSKRRWLGNLQRRIRKDQGRK